MTPTFAPDPLVTDTIRRLLAERCSIDRIADAEVDLGWAPAVWDAVEEAGFTMVTEASGASLADIGAIITAVGHAAAPLPLPETLFLGSWLCEQAALSVPPGPLAVAPPEACSVAGDVVTIQGPVAWARSAAHIVAVINAMVVVIDPLLATIQPGQNLAGEARDMVLVQCSVSEVLRGEARSDLSAELSARGILSRALLSSGALEAVSQLTIDYTQQRHQFGKPVATFQAVQQHLVTVAQSAVRCQMAATVALRSLATDGFTEFTNAQIAAAHLVMSDAIDHGLRAAHQAHGAMGVTREYRLQHYSRRLWSWQHEWRSPAQSRSQLGSMLLAQGADRLYDFVAH